jgi:tripartite-type tricarboxylate transporter receptor subunit TctC
MRKTTKLFMAIAGALVLTLALAACNRDGDASSTGGWDPYAQPITIVTHVAPGGGMDVATRLFIDIARQYTDATIIVENMAGGGTRIASDEVLGRPADGYTIFGAAMSNVNTAVAQGWDLNHYIDGYDWIAKIQRDPAAVIITNEAKNAGMDFHGILQQARDMGGDQIWAVPVLGGNKHFEALLIWQATGVEGMAMPFESGPLGAAAVLGGEAHVQMGNPFDTSGRDLWVAAIASPERMPGFEDSPTFAELGFPQLNDMHMWRGYAVRKGTPPEMISWFQNLVTQVSRNPEWIEYNAGNAIAPTAVFTEEFRAIIQDTIETTEYWSRYLGILN